ncbi:caffeine-induced death protein 2-domain-containing protein [Lipomyces arxii]|uniref:caffeine-induced death protein 2-domain-containing protein n=1 Tax=Lipomyces arxii TaxID=56418 RepID=UPI0034CD085D
MSSIAGPNLTPELCYTPQSLRRFLLLSRSLTDDTISEDINSIPTVSDTYKFLGSGSNWSKPDRTKVGSRRRLCTDFVDKNVFPSWRAREEVLEFCTEVAIKNKHEAVSVSKPRVDPRLDPYEARNIPEYSKEDQILDWISKERSIEDIVRNRSWNVICENCLDVGVQLDQTKFSVVVGENGNGWRHVFGNWLKN